MKGKDIYKKRKVTLKACDIPNLRQEKKEQIHQNGALSRCISQSGWP